MNKNKLQNISAAFLAIAALAAPFSLNAADSTSTATTTNTPAKTEASVPAANAAAPAAKTAKVSSLPFKGSVVAIDKTAKTFSIGTKVVRVFAVTDKTKLINGKAAATFADLAIGTQVTGAYTKTADGKLDAVSVKISKETAKVDSKKTAVTQPATKA